MVRLTTSNMRISRVSQGLLYSFFAVVLLTCLFGTSFHTKYSHNVSSQLKRSLPASLITAPAGAVGYYHPPPGPAADEAPPTETWGVPPKSITTAREIMHELRQVSPALNNTTITDR